MTKMTVNIPDDDVPFLKEMLDRIGLAYEMETDEQEFQFTDEEIAGFVKTKQDYLDGKMTGRNWDEVKNDLNRVFGRNS